jgi:GT2 family glycosyltransferase
MPRSFAVYWRQALSVARSRGFHTLIRLIARRMRRLTGRYHPGFYDFEYAKWRNNRPVLSNPEDGVFGPHFSIIVPVYDVEKKWLTATIDSVRAQHYQDWQLCLINDGSTKTHIKLTLDHYAASDTRIITHHHRENLGIAQSSNTGLSIADGEYIILLDHDDLLEPDALSVLALTIANHADADLIYSDEDKIDSEDIFSHPFFKPGYSPALLLSQNYFGHLVACSRELLQDIGGFRTGFDGAQDYDLVLRGSRAAKRIVHIPQVLYHWRQIVGSTAFFYGEKDYAWSAGQRALQDHLNNYYPGSKAEKGHLPGTYRVDYKIDDRPAVSVIIPFRDQPELLDRCLSALFTQTDWRPLEVIGIDNQSGQQGVDQVKQKWSASQPGLRFIDYPHAFNFSSICNFGVETASGDYIVLLNNDVEIISPDWVESMLGLAQDSNAGAIGAILRYPDRSIQHAGIVTGIGGYAGHPFKGFEHNQIGYFGRLEVDSNVSAVTAALLMVSRQKYLKVGGLDEDNFGIALNDVDFCLKLMQSGYQNVVTAKCQAIHHESASRGYDNDPSRRARHNKEIEYFQQKWASVLEQGDPYYNPNLSLESEDYTLRW